MKYKIAYLFLFYSVSACSTTSITEASSPNIDNQFVAATQDDGVSERIIRKVVPVPKPMPMPGQLKNIETSEYDESDNSEHTWEVIHKANKAATHKPSKFSYFNAIMKYDYADGALYNIYSAPTKLTDIQLQPGEKIMGDVASGDTVRWILGTGTSMRNGVEIQHVYVKPTRPDLHTTLSINTDRRTYHIELRSFKNTYMAAVNWRYPRDEMLALKAKEDSRIKRNAHITSTNINIENVNFNYEIKIKKGKSPKWLPKKVFDDGRKTFISFPKDMLNREAPVLFVLSHKNKPQLVNYRVQNDYFIVDRLFDAAELRLGEKKQTIVRIIRNKDSMVTAMEDYDVE